MRSSSVLFASEAPPETGFTGGVPGTWGWTGVFGVPSVFFLSASRRGPQMSSERRRMLFSVICRMRSSCMEMISSFLSAIYFTTPFFRITFA